MCDNVRGIFGRCGSPNAIRDGVTCPPWARQDVHDWQEDKVIVRLVMETLPPSHRNSGRLVIYLKMPWILLDSSAVFAPSLAPVFHPKCMKLHAFGRSPPIGF